MKTLTPEQIAELINAGWTPPQQQVIDWSRVACHVPVKVDPPDDGRFFLPRIVFRLDHGLERFEWVPGRNPTLETGLWVVNVDGKQPVPDGVLVTTWMRNDRKPEDGYGCPAGMWAWELGNGSHDIIAFRVVGLAEGYCYAREC